MPVTLDKYVVITAEMPTSLNVRSTLSPHGLQFLKPVTQTLTYKHCANYKSLTAQKKTAYLDASSNVLEWLASQDSYTEGKVVSGLKHFSDYAIGFPDVL